MQIMRLPANFNPAFAPQPARIDPDQVQATLQGPSSLAPSSPFANPMQRPTSRPYSMPRPAPRPMRPQSRPLMMPEGISLGDLLPTGFNPAYAPQPISGGFRPQQFPPMMGGGFGPYGGGFGRPPMMGGGFGPYGGGFGRPFARSNPYGQGGIGGFFNQMAMMTPEQYQMGMDRYGQFSEQFGPQMGGGFGMFNQLASLTPEQYQMGMDRFGQFQNQFGSGFQPGTPQTPPAPQFGGFRPAPIANGFGPNINNMSQPMGGQQAGGGAPSGLF